MNRARLEHLLGRFPQVSVLVVGDFFLDKYLVIDRRLGEPSLETGLEAHQVVAKRCSPGAAGTVTSNLRALGARVAALGVIGADGEGYDLKRGLLATGVDAGLLIETPDRFTPAYTKPMMREPDGGEHEINRIDVKNRRPMSDALQGRVIDLLREAVPRVDGVIVADQVEEPDFGVVTARVREALAGLAEGYPEKVFFADSRAHVGLFRGVVVKPNRREAARALHPGWEGEVDRGMAERCGQALYERSRKPVYLTMSEEGLLLFTEAGCQHVPAVRVTGEIDPVGAGDSATAGIVSALCAGATYQEAALVGNLVASITVRQVGTTGTASPEQALRRFYEQTSKEGR
jgi:rfaE bifunctional protein kinase chain/domain